METFIKIRALTAGGYPCFDAIEIAEEIDLPLEVRQDPTLQRLERLANNILAWTNDIMSLHKDLQHGNVHNLVIILQQERQLGFQEAMDCAAELHDASMRSFVAWEQSLPSFGAAVDIGLQRYLSGLHSWMRGNLDWYRESGRYQPTATMVVD